MFLAEVLTVLVKGMEATFDDDFPVANFRNLKVGMEYPADEQSYPSIWVDFEPSVVRTAGIAHEEYLTQNVGGETRFGKVTRWRFEGQATFTVVTMSALARAQLLDEVIRTIGFGARETGREGFHEFVANNDLIAMTVNSDDLPIRGMAASPGTPWGTEDVIYEVTVATPLIGEFTSTPQGNIVPLSDIDVIAYADIEEDPTTGDGWS